MFMIDNIIPVSIALPLSSWVKIMKQIRVKSVSVIKFESRKTFKLE